MCAYRISLHIITSEDSVTYCLFTWELPLQSGELLVYQIEELIDLDTLVQLFP